MARAQYVEQLERDRQLHDELVAKRRTEKYHKHYHMCAQLLDQMLDFAIKVIEYRELTSKWVSIDLLVRLRQRRVNGVLCQGLWLFEMGS